MSGRLEREWIVASSGVFRGSPTEGFSRMGFFDFNTNAILRGEERLYAGANCGVWRVDAESGRWTQLHDETVTEVLALASHPGTAGVAVGCPYGLATGGLVGGSGVLRWGFLSNALGVNHRFTTALLRLDSDSSGADYLVGTEGGLLVARGAAAPDAGWESGRTPEVRWEITSIPSVPVRALICVGETYFAGTDGRGVWSTGDGVIWKPAGGGASDRTVFDLAWDGRVLVGGTDGGLIVGDGEGAWASVGPRVLASSVGADRNRPGEWLVGARPSGLWWTDSSGRRFAQVGDLSNVGAILPPVA